MSHTTQQNDLSSHVVVFESLKKQSGQSVGESVSAA